MYPSALHMTAAGVVVALGLAGRAPDYPSLTEEQRIRLDTAFDGRDHREEAFVALVEHVQAWDGELGDVAVRLQPDLEAMADDPVTFRGELCRVQGVLSQQTRLAPPHETATEWFVRNEQGVPFMVFFVDVAPGSAPDAPFRDGDTIEMFARFYKMVEFTARDGQNHRYAAFVGSHPRRIGPAAGPVISPLVTVGVPVVLLAIAFTLLMLNVRRQRRAPVLHQRHAPPDEQQVANEAELPDDPVDALTTLRKRSESTEDSRE